MRFALSGTHAMCFSTRFELNSKISRQFIIALIWFYRFHFDCDSASILQLLQQALCCNPQAHSDWNICVRLVLFHMHTYYTMAVYKRTGWLLILKVLIIKPMFEIYAIRRINLNLLCYVMHTFIEETDRYILSILYTFWVDSIHSNWKLSASFRFSSSSAVGDASYVCLWVCHFCSVSYSDICHLSTLANSSVHISTT